ncbi:melatonin receptor type 1C-like [Convolutriloba macropyga]|uniref:melatonin receptor type 1C-like n=1 Tax=Convolutriloba macropyga TaxID=536237 RepID=UPI003F51FF82
MLNVSYQTPDGTDLPFYEEWLLPLNELENERLIKNRLFMMIWLMVALAIGIPGNILVIASIALVKHLRQVPHLFVVNLAISDLGVMMMNVFVLIGVFFGDTVLPRYPWLCELSGAFCMLSCFGSLWTMMFVAVNRFVFICKNEIYDRFFDLKGTIACIILIWVCVTMLDLPNFPFMGFGGHEFTNLFLHCSYEFAQIQV